MSNKLNKVSDYTDDLLKRIEEDMDHFEREQDLYSMFEVMRLTGHLLNAVASRYIIGMVKDETYNSYMTYIDNMQTDVLHIIQAIEKYSK